MEPFIRSDQYNFINAQTQLLMNGHSTVNDKNVLRALKTLATEKVFNLFTDMNDEQTQLLNPISHVENHVDAEIYLTQIHPFVIPFKKVSEQTIKKLFPKAKMLKVPILENIDWKEISYLGWNDKGTNRKYMVALYQNKLIGLHGSFRLSNHKGICALCNRFEELGMFISETKGSVQGTFIKRGNYICQDSQKCNQNMINLEKLHAFIDHIKRS
ncbi:FusB/FusC family EF-G-binding protein [Peribacillus alkalitolerans]|uniref:FusB/FusC family EF-G-binding protein n=1 Tax=Peribacillus alkalitolerans TaxID=1550385 RepID=UPI0013D80C5D|nr:FusB/FusC family EF-G-binding protein [Peribacillus alkalitolerans]